MREFIETAAPCFALGLVEEQRGSSLSLQRLYEYATQMLVVEQEHQEESSQHADGVVGWPATGTRGIERTQERASRVQIEPQEHEGGFMRG